MLLIIGSIPAGSWAVRGAAVVGSGGPGDDTLVIVLAGGLLGIGAGMLAAVAAPPLDERSTRIGLALTSLGLLGMALGRAVVVIPPGTNELQSWPYIILVLGGGLVSLAGWIATGLSLVRVPGGPRLAGLLLLAGLVILVVGGSAVPPPIWMALAPTGAVAVGLLALRGVGSTPLVGRTG